MQNGFQRYRCKSCKKTFSDIPARPLENLRVSPETAHLVVRLLCEGTGVRACERLAGVNRRTVLNILELAGYRAQRLMNERVRNIAAKHVSVDEMWAFVGCLPDNNREENEERGEQFTFLAVDQDTKMILHWHTGKRDEASTCNFLNGLKDRTAGKFQLTTDEFSAYVRKGVSSVFGNNVDYGTEMKTFGTAKPRIPGQRHIRRLNPVVCTAVQRKTKIGNPDRSWMTTNHSERCNLSIRLFNRRFTRKTLGYSKKMTNHKSSVALQVAYFNFCRFHSAVKIDATETAPAKQQTPAMAQGLTDHIWTVEELFGQI